MRRPWLATAEATRILTAAVEDNQRVDREIAENERPCPMCTRTAYLRDTGANGVKSFMCSNDHLFLVAPEGRS